MKKVLLTAVVAVIVLGSCKKKYTCECTVTVKNPASTTVTKTESSSKMKKKEAEDWCKKSNTTVGQVTTVCKLL